MTAIQKENLLNSFCYTNESKWQFPPSINTINCFNVSPIGALILMAFDDESIKHAISTYKSVDDIKKDFEQFIRLCCASLHTRKIEPDWPFVALIASKTESNMGDSPIYRYDFSEMFPPPVSYGRS